MNTLESEVKMFIGGLPYWEKYLCGKIISGKSVSEDDIGVAHNYLLEYLNLREPTEKPIIEISDFPNSIGEYKDDLTLMELNNIEGVNALIENQKIKFNKDVTIIYGVNGTGKSGYVRLLKKVFYSKSEEIILPNIYSTKANKKISANFKFDSDGVSIPLGFPEKRGIGIFSQYSVFDGKSVLQHLDKRNDFEFRPAGLALFFNFQSVLNKLQLKHKAVINSKSTINNFSEIFEGNSEIKRFIANLSASSKLEELRKHTPLSEEDKSKKEKLQKEHDDLKLSLTTKDKKIDELIGIRDQLSPVKKNLENINSWFNNEYLGVVRAAIADCNEKEEIAKKDSVDNFQTNKINNVGSTEWRAFIEAASRFALKQRKDDKQYPVIGDNCLLCHQSIDKDQQLLITSYWDFIKSLAEQEAKESQLVLNKMRKGFEDIKFKQFPEKNILTVWLFENHPHVVELLIDDLRKQKELSVKIISSIDSKVVFSELPVAINVEPITHIEEKMQTQINTLKEGNENTVLENLDLQIVYLSHKEKLQRHIENIEHLHQNMVWVNKARRIDWQTIKTKVTTVEKGLSKKYFNQQYIDNFNNECNHLNGNFEIDIDSRSSDAISNRKLLIKGKAPSAVLSEGEQKVAALADFLSEVSVSEINKGIVLDDPVNSLDETRKKQIAERLVDKSVEKQVIVFTHDLIFVSMLIASCDDSGASYYCHWAEKRDKNVGYIWLNNSPSYEKEYRSSVIPVNHYSVAKKKETPPAQREFEIRTGFTALRTCYEVLVINDLFKNVVKRFDERVSVDSLSSVYFDKELVDELLDSFGQCCRYMEGHSHSDKYAYKKPSVSDLNTEIQRYEALRGKIKKYKPSSINNNDN